MTLKYNHKQMSPRWTKRIILAITWGRLSDADSSDTLCRVQIEWGNLRWQMMYRTDFAHASSKDRDHLMYDVECSSKTQMDFVSSYV